MNADQLTDGLQTPFLLIDKNKLQANVHRIQTRIESLGAVLRPHLKTVRSLEATALILPTRSAPATVSTLAEAEALADAGYDNLLYAVGISANKLERAAALLRRGVNLHILLDSQEQAAEVAEYGLAHGVTFSAFIEIDCDGHRGGLPAADPAVVDIARRLSGAGASFQGLLTHAGESYSCSTPDCIRAAARQECGALLQTAELLQSQGIACPTLSVGSTPTAHFADDLTGITEVRAGVFTLFDLFMHNVGVCAMDDIAISIVATVIGHNKRRNTLFIDAGWMALSRDRGTASQKQDYLYGQVCDMSGTPLPGVRVNSANQEHGLIELPADGPCALEHFPIGSRLRILPNHACATTAMHLQYQAIDEKEGTREVWTRITGW
ncbi:alanine racemase [Leminorella grimontii]|uniref:alanine racemase n=1 Tax=Leminorella grimontii TaxID=82981 RepID=UPI0020826FB8|nr:alanine racemase [Leminorella grimontii]GKX57875.1 alanine racemase [Leminorella grimontii]